jgi:hypothetical protein
MTSLYPFDDRSHGGPRISCSWCGPAVVVLFALIALVLSVWAPAVAPWSQAPRCQKEILVDGTLFYSSPTPGRECLIYESDLP